MYSTDIIVYIGRLSAYSSYPFDNCGVAFPTSGIPVNNPQDLIGIYFSHQSALSIVTPYLNTSNIAQTNGFPFYMFETNTASCGGFPGLSDAFGAALWGIDYGMQMAAVNFTTALFHIGGQNVSYNAFTRAFINYPCLVAFCINSKYVHQHPLQTSRPSTNGRSGRYTTPRSSSQRRSAQPTPRRSSTSQRTTTTR